MKTVRVGNSGLQVSVVGLGCNNFGSRLDEAQSTKIVERALDLGVTLFDTADIYGGPSGNSETILGRALGARRKDVVVVTKFGIDLQAGGRGNGSRSYALNAIEKSLQRLDTDYIDVFMFHLYDAETPTDETLRALDEIIRSGKARYIACSNHAAWHVVDAMWVARQINSNAFIAVSNEYSLAVRDAEQDLIPALSAHGLGLLPYFPLASGLLTGKYSKKAREKPDGRLASNYIGLGDRFLTERNLAMAEELNEFAIARGHTLLELAIGWLAMRPTVSGVIAGASAPEQVERNVRAADWMLSADDLAEVDRICNKEEARI